MAALHTVLFDELWRAGGHLIEATIQPGDPSPILRGFVRAFKARVYVP